MEHKVHLHLLVILLAFFLIISITSAVPLPRSLKAITARLSAQDLQDQMAQKRLLEEEESFLKGRMDLEIRDYSGTGANNRHDPNPPGSD